ncbi:MAG: FRG domain-containing protein [Firmicutes bacterium]|nr:FRG domain-containing protein [Bacillota bacterium]
MEQVNDIYDYLRVLERYSAYSEKYYRGQLKKYDTISPSIARDRGYFSHESEIYHESVEMKKDEFNNLSTPLQKLAKLQHYGIPTRLVDVTIDPLIALYFAIENIDDSSSGNVYLYLVDGYSFDSKEVEVLSILPTMPIREVNYIITEYEKIFGKSITYEEVLEIVSTPVIVQYSDELKTSNPRLHSQKGTFLICGNEVIDSIITNSLKSLDTITPNVIINIPYEYKKEIKEELDLKYNINQFRIYPELPAVASYIKEKYKEENLSLSGKYSIVKKEDISYAFVKRISITIVLTKSMYIAEIKSLVIAILDQYKKNENVVWVYVARNGDDYIMSNWILRGQWIDPTLNEKYRPLPLKNFEEGYYWEYSKSYNIVSDFDEKYVFDDRTLFSNHEKIWGKFHPIYQILQEFYQKNKYDDLIAEIIKQKLEINQIYMQLQDFGRYHDKDFDDFLNIFANCISLIDNLNFIVENEKASDKFKQYEIKKIMDETEIMVEQINNGMSESRDKLYLNN